MCVSIVKMFSQTNNRGCRGRSPLQKRKTYHPRPDVKNSIKEKFAANIPNPQTTNYLFKKHYLYHFLTILLTAVFTFVCYNKGTKQETTQQRVSRKETMTLWNMY